MLRLGLTHTQPVQFSTSQVQQYIHKFKKNERNKMGSLTYLIENIKLIQDTRKGGGGQKYGHGRNRYKAGFFMSIEGSSSYFCSFCLDISSIGTQVSYIMTFML